jgi:hypothetical protein
MSMQIYQRIVPRGTRTAVHICVLLKVLLKFQPKKFFVFTHDFDFILVFVCGFFGILSEGFRMHYTQIWVKTNHFLFLGTSNATISHFLPQQPHIMSF